MVKGSRDFPLSVEHSLIPRPGTLPEKHKEGLVFVAILLSHEAGPYFIKNVIVGFLNVELEPPCIWTTTQPHLQILKITTKFIGTAEKQPTRPDFQFSS